MAQAHIGRKVSEIDFEERLARELADSTTADELRKWSARNGIRRERGDTKLETARKAVEQKPDAVLKYLSRSG